MLYYKSTIVNYSEVEVNFEKEEERREKIASVSVIEGPVCLDGRVYFFVKFSSVNVNFSD